jgi:predicted metal-dependent HD superfamily phosphohydrolase
MDAVQEELYARWRSLVAGKGSSVDVVEAPFAVLLALYSAPGRYRHDAARVLRVLKRIDELILHATDPFVPRFAAFYSDAVRSALPRNDAERSNAMAQALLAKLGASPEAREGVREAIFAVHWQGAAVSANTKVVVDADLDHLAADWTSYVADAVAARKEYYFLPTLVYGFVRRVVLKRILERKTIFSLEAADDAVRGGPEARDGRARENIRRELGALKFRALVRLSRRGFDLTPLFN